MSIYYKYQIPDKTRPIPKNQRGWVGPSGELIDFEPNPVAFEDVAGRTIKEFSPSLGTYGMGGPGFLGLKLGQEWLVIAISGAGEWMTSKGRNVEDSFHDKYNRPTPWLADWLPGEAADELSKNLVETKISSLQVLPKSLRIDFSNGYDLTVLEEHSSRPILEGSKEPREFKSDDDLRKAVFLSPTNEIWV